MYRKNTKLICFCLLFFMSLNFVPGGMQAAAAEFAGGDGTEGNPYQVATLEHLKNVRNYLNAHFIQTADIDMGEAGAYRNWSPIGTEDNEFTGKYDGGGHRIIDVECYQTSAGTVAGLFGYNSGIVCNLTVDGRCANRISTNNKLVTSALAGGIAAVNDGTIANCVYTGSVHANNSCSETPSISAVAGGIAGNNGGIIMNCYNESEVSADLDASSGLGGAYAGGIAGSNRGIIQNCYNTGRVSAKNAYHIYSQYNSTCVGGIAAFHNNTNTYKNTIEYCYNVGEVVVIKGENIYIGGIVGDVNDKSIRTEITRCYYLDSDTFNSDEGSSLTDAEMKIQSSFWGFDFTNVWGISPDVNDGYPYLRNSPGLHIHNWGAWTITKQPTQTETGTAERVCQNDSNHKETKDLPILTDTATWTKGDYQAPTCEADGYQKYNSEYGTVTETIPATGHNWGAWTITKQPTQTETGTAERVCENDSSHKDQKELPVLTDTATWTKGDYQAPNCEADGSQIYTSEYGTVTETLEKLGHSFTNYVSDGNATCETDGTETAKCDRCDATDTRTAVGSATGHSWGAWTITKEPTQAENGTAERVCQNDNNHNDTMILPVLTDTATWTKGEYKAPTCEADGYQKYTSVYGEITEAIPATGHNWGAWTITKQPTQNETGTAERVCQNDGSHKDTKELPVLTDSSVWTKGEYQAPTCDTDGYQKYTSEYGEVTETIPATDHNWGAWTITKQPTQTETGTAERVCQNDSSHKDMITLPVLNDTNVWTKGEYQAPTCETDGYQKYTSEYGEVTEILPATDHNWGAWTITKQPTQTETGTAERVCQNDSSHKDTMTLPVLTDTVTWTKGEYQAPTCDTDGYQKYTSDYGEVTETLPATGHSWGTWTITKQPTQTETGTAERVCKNDSSHKDMITLPVLTDTATWTKGDYQVPTCEADGYQKYTSQYGEVTETIPATNHNWGAWYITKQPTQTETGTVERICQNDSSHKDQKELPVLTDTTVWTKGEYKAPTCETDGYQKYTSDYGEITETIPATGHSWGAWAITKQPTQTEIGTAERVCENDNSHKEQKDLSVLTDTATWTKGEYQAPTCETDGYQKYTSEYGEVTEILPATDHNWGAWTITKQPTQTETGTAERICQNDNSHKDQKELPVLTDTTVWIKGDYQAPTCEADGYQKYTSDYGEVTETIPATGHNWGAWNITKQPTQTEIGTAERVCQNDSSHKDTMTLPVLTDTNVWAKGDYQAPTCEADGYQKYTSDYGEVTETISATDHSWGAWTITKQPTQTETGTAERVCENDSSHKDTVSLPVLTDASVWTAGERVEPTCTADGSQVYTSDYGTVTEPLPATDHTFEWVIDRPATVEEPGIKHEECTKCHEKRNENTEIPQLPVESYVIHYDANGGSGTMPDGAALKDKEFTLPENAFTPPAGKQFKCWAIGSIDGTEIQPGTGFIFTENTTVYAVWENIGFTITFDKNGGSSVSAETMVTNPDGKLSELPTAERSGRYRFKGWYTEKSGGTEVTKETVFTEDTTVYAQWSYTGGSFGGGGGGISVTRYTVTFDTQGGSEIDSVRVTRNSTVAKPEEPTREGYIFEGWYTDKECSEAYDFDTKVTKNITLYAKWTEETPDEPTDPDEPENPDEWENPFDDVDEGDWFYDDVKNAYENGLFSGVTDTSFAPNEAITRGMMVTVLYRAENEPETASRSKFEDVAPDAYYTKAVIWAENNGIVKGYSEVEFAPDKLISREEMAAIMHRYAGYKGADTGVSGDLMKFADQAQIADWARENVAWAVGYGLLSGKGNNLLDPQRHTTRAETAAILNRFLKK